MLYVGRLLWNCPKICRHFLFICRLVKHCPSLFFRYSEELLSNTFDVQSYYCPKNWNVCKCSSSWYLFSFFFLLCLKKQLYGFFTLFPLYIFPAYRWDISKLICKGCKERTFPKFSHRLSPDSEIILKSIHNILFYLRNWKSIHRLQIFQHVSNWNSIIIYNLHTYWLNRCL